MDVEKILRAGYFDRLKIDGVLKPVYNSTGTVIMHGESFKQSLDKSEEAFKHGVAHLKLSLIGECDTNICFSDLEHMREDRQRWGITKLPSTESVDRYLVAYLDILILKSDYAIPYKIVSNGKTEKDIEKLAKTNDALEVFLAALELGKYIIKKYNYSTDWVNIAIIDKVYVLPIFRRCRISTWLHENIADIINMYSLVFPNGIILSYGDFSKEAEKQFNMDRNTYNKMLISHYKSMGYGNISKLGLSGIDNTNNILYKLLV